jgi:2-haloacid dehalogenase
MVILKPPSLILLDVYDTLLNMSDIEKKVNYFLNSKRAYILWFELLIQYTMVDNFTGKYHEFSAIADATLKMTAESLKERIDESQINEILEMFRHLPVQEDVSPGLSGLIDQGFRIAALTNSSEKIIRDRMEKSGLVSYFEQVLSCERIKKYKPHREVYLWAADCLSLAPEDILFVSSHSWDLAGAENAGMRTAYLNHHRLSHYSLLPSPKYISRSLADLCNQLKLLKTEKPNQTNQVG